MWANGTVQWASIVIVVAYVKHNTINHKLSLTCSPFVIMGSIGVRNATTQWVSIVIDVACVDHNTINH